MLHSGGQTGRLLEASYRGDLIKIRRILDKGVDVNSVGKFRAPETHTLRNVTPLLLSSRHGVLYSVEYLIDRGADLDFQLPEDGNTAIMEAAKYGHLRVVVALVEAGCDIHKANMDGQTAADLAEAAGHSLVVRVLNDPKSVNLEEIRDYRPTLTSRTLKSVDLKVGRFCCSLGGFC